MPSRADRPDRHRRRCARRPCPSRRRQLRRRIASWDYAQAADDEALILNIEGDDGSHVGVLFIRRAYFYGGALEAGELRVRLASVVVTVSAEED